jgi:RimJ/RimL family protein N-acetyltransferase
VFAGTSGQVSDDVLAFHLSRLCADPGLFEAMSARAWRLTDAEGARRLAAALAPPSRESLSLRPVETRDKLLLFHWANDPQTRANAIDRRTIRWDEHVAWFARKQHADRTLFRLFVTPSGLPVGQLRIEPEGNSAGVVHFSIEPAMRGQGFGGRLIQLAVDLWRHTGRVGPLLGDVRAENTPSRRAFTKAGFQLQENRQHGILRYVLHSG